MDLELQALLTFMQGEDASVARIIELAKKGIAQEKFMGTYKSADCPYCKGTGQREYMCFYKQDGKTHAGGALCHCDHDTIHWHPASIAKWEQLSGQTWRG